VRRRLGPLTDELDHGEHEDEAERDEACRPKLCLLARNEPLRRLGAEKLSMEWSPEQIAGHLAEHFAIDTEMRVSHEAIYNSLFMQARGVLAKRLQKHLRSRRPICGRSGAMCTTR
jgi:IS30 family transposase